MKREQDSENKREYHWQSETLLAMLNKYFRSYVYRHPPPNNKKLEHETIYWVMIQKNLEKSRRVYMHNKISEWVKIVRTNIWINIGWWQRITAEAQNVCRQYKKWISRGLEYRWKCKKWTPGAKDELKIQDSQWEQRIEYLYHKQEKDYIEVESISREKFNEEEGEKYNIK